jgi:acetate kinase
MNCYQYACESDQQREKQRRSLLWGRSKPFGNAASVTAVKGDKSIDTGGGLTPTGGVTMGTWSGDLDPGVLVHLMREKKFDAAGRRQRRATPA